VFRRGELETLLSAIHNIVVEESYFDHANWAVRIRKVA
jgi:hypothetical protein